MRIRRLLRVPGKIPEARAEVVEAIQRMDGGVSRSFLQIPENQPAKGDASFVRMQVAPVERERKKLSLGKYSS